MPFNGKRSYRKKRGAPKKRNYKKRGGVSLATKRYVKRTIHAQIEDKFNYVANSGERLATPAVNPGLLTVSMIPYTQITQGVGQGQRIGNTIRTKRVEFNFSIFPAPYNQSTNSQPVPQEVIMMFGKVKNSRAQQPIASDYAHIWQTGNTSTGPYSTLLDLLGSVNKDYFTVYKVCRFKVGYASSQGSGNTVADQFFANNDFKLNITKRMNITSMVPKIVKFNDGTAQNTNDGLWMWAWCVNADGSFTAQYQPAEMAYTLNYTFEDA